MFTGLRLRPYLNSICGRSPRGKFVEPPHIQPLAPSRRNEDVAEGRCEMAVSDVRSHKRIPNESVVDLVRTDGARIKETAFAQNVSAVGIRLTTEKIWRPGDCVLLTPS